jgi:NhaC family Na+:H+ antiporter
MVNISRKASLFEALLPMLVLVGLLAFNVYVFGVDSSFGGNQIALLLSACVAALVGFRLGIKWIKMREGIIKSISSTLQAIIILLLIGALAGTWLLSGVIPAMVYYGLQILSPGIFLFAACVISSVVSLGTGSSWSTVATVGIALLGIGRALGFDEGLVAGAIISGAYFGDKISPLSDTTNLAPAMAGTDLFTHIRHMTWTTIPAILITLLIFLIIGFTYNTNASKGEMDVILTQIESKFNITPFLFIVPIVVILMIIKKIAPIPALLTGTLLGGIFGIIFQPGAVSEIGSETRLYVEVETQQKDYKLEWTSLGETGSLDNALVENNGSYINMIEPGKYAVNVTNDNGLSGTAEILVPDYGESITDGDKYPLYLNDEQIGNVYIRAERSNYAYSAYKAFVNAMSIRTSIKTQDDSVNSLLAQKGMSGMLNTVWLILCAMIFGGIMEMAGLLSRITESIIRLANTTGSLIAATTGTCIFFNITASDQYLAIVVPGRMYQDTYRKRGIKPENLSRTLEDSGTVTSVLVPWNTCGATQSSVLGVATITYLPFCFFNILSPIITVIYGYLGIKVPMITPGENNPNQPSLHAHTENPTEASEKQ